MSTIHNAISQGRGLLTSFGNLVGLKAEEEGTVRLGETLQPILNVWDLPEAAFLRDEHRFAKGLRQDAVALEFGFVGIRNHTGSGKVMVVDQFDASSETAGRIFATVSLSVATDVDTTIAVRPEDTRWSTTSGFNLIRGAGAARVGDDFAAVAIAAGGVYRYDHGFVLHPGRDLRVYFGTVAVAVLVTFYGRVRAFVPGGERTK